MLDLTLHLKPGALTVGLDPARVYSFDAEGRPFHALRHGKTYKRGLDHRFMVLWREVQEDEPVRRRRFLSPVEARSLVATLHQDLRQEVLPNLHRAALRVTPGPGVPEAGPPPNLWPRLAEAPHPLQQAVQETLHRILERDETWLAEDARRFRKIYSPLGILPPDQYLALVLQVTQGCHWNQCLFCDLYTRIPFRIRPLPEVLQHLEAVLRFFGRALPLRKSVFLADANALMLPERRATELLEHLAPRIRQAMPWSRGFFSFLDVFTGERHPVAYWQRLAHLGLRRLYIGLESAHEPLIRWLNKPETREGAWHLLLRLKEAGLSVGVIVLVGAGGHRFREPHFRDTVAFLRAFPRWEPRDIVYLSPFVPPEKPEYHERVRADRIQPLTETEIRREIRRFQQALHDLPPRVTLYNIQDFLY